MKYARVAAFVAAFCLFAGTLLHAGYRYLMSPGSSAAHIGSDNPVCDLGAVSAGRRFPCTFSLENRGGRELVIQEVKVSCRGCLEVLAFPNEPLPPGGSGVVHVAFSTAGLQGKVDRGLVVRSNDPKRPAFMLRVIADVQTDVRGP